MKVAYVVPRYGTEIRGGAETGARMFAEHLVADRGYDGRGLHHLRPRCADLAGRAARGHRDDQRGHGAPHRLGGRAGRGLPPAVGPLAGRPRAGQRGTTWQRWVDLQGPKSPALLDAVAASDADVIAFYPYLYYPTIRGLPLVRERAIMHPAAHEEPALHLPLFEELFAQCRGFVFQTRSERQLVVDLLRRGHHAAGAGRPGCRGSRPGDAAAARGRPRPR